MKSNELLKTIGLNINNIRREKGVKGETLGKELGVSKAAISNLENGLVDLKISTLQQIATILDTEVVTLLEENSAVSSKGATQSEYREQISKHIRVIDMLVCRIEYMNEQIECMRLKKVS